MQIRDLSKPVNAAKADWLAGTNWFGFTPSDDSVNARAQCQSTVVRQCDGGYVIEYITENFGVPNPGYKDSAQYLNDKAAHERVAGCLVAVHLLRPSPRPLQEIVGEAHFAELQNMWAAPDKRRRWSIAFPIVESYAIVPPIKAKALIKDGDPMPGFFGRQSATLLRLTDGDRKLIENLTIVERAIENAWIAIEDEIRIAERPDSGVDPAVSALIDQDLEPLSQEGHSIERIMKLRKRAAWLAGSFIRERQSQGRLKCDDCGFDPELRIDGTGISARTILDVHHKNPLSEGTRYTKASDSDFALLCPTCHRLEHARISACSRGGDE